jgi:nitroimidazol reductase NimA-like FMN-containing flavoprotein (pyridoxamine 5'-phosphate oxidase superfamily)
MSTEKQLGEKVGQSRQLSQTEREEFLAQPHVGVLSVSSDDDRPPSTLPTWYAYQPGGNIAVITRKDKRKSRLIRRAGKLSFSVQRPEVPYRYVTVEGAVVKQERPTREELASIGRRYLPADTVDAWVEWELGGGTGNGEPEYIEIRPDRWLTQDFS